MAIGNRRTLAAIVRIHYLFASALKSMMAAPFQLARPESGGGFSKGTIPYVAVSYLKVGLEVESDRSARRRETTNCLSGELNGEYPSTIMTSPGSDSTKRRDLRIDLLPPFFR